MCVHICACERHRQWKSEFGKYCECLKKVLFYKLEKLSRRRTQLKKKSDGKLSLLFWVWGGYSCAIYSRQETPKEDALPQTARSCICIIKNVPALASSQYWAKCSSFSWEFVFQGWLYLLFYFCGFFWSVPPWGATVGCFCGVGGLKEGVLWVLFWILVNKKAGNLPSCYSVILKHDANCLNLEHRRCWKIFLRRSWNI